MGDLISRQAAIVYVDDVPYIKEHPNIGLLWKAWIEQLPPVQPERKLGKWIQKSKKLDLCTDWWYECSECGKRPPRSEWTSERYLSNYCPNCGARMDGEQ